MFELPLPSPADVGHVVSLDQSSPGQVVLGHLPDGLGQATSEYCLRDGVWRTRNGGRQFQRRRKEQYFFTIDPADGTMQKCFMNGRHPFGFGLHEVERHPVTGQILTGLQPPIWQGIVKLGKKAALAFFPSRCLDLGYCHDVCRSGTDRGQLLLGSA